MIREADREDQIAAARALPTNVSLQLPDAPLVEAGLKHAAAEHDAGEPDRHRPEHYCANPQRQAATTTRQLSRRLQRLLLQQRPSTAAAVEELPSFVPAPKSLISDQAAAKVATVNTGTARKSECSADFIAESQRDVARYEVRRDACGAAQFAAGRRRDEGW